MIPQLPTMYSTRHRTPRRYSEKDSAETEQGFDVCGVEEQVCRHFLAYPRDDLAVLISG